MPTVSVTNPAYNSGCQPDEAVRPAVAQTFNGWKWVVARDGPQEDSSPLEKSGRACAADRDSSTGHFQGPEPGILRGGRAGLLFLRAMGVRPERPATGEHGLSDGCVCK